MIVGFSSGVLYKSNNISTKELIVILESMGITAIELMCNDTNKLEELLNNLTLEDFKKIEHVSLHAPVLASIPLEELEKLLFKIEELHRKLNLKYVVLHPDGINNWKVFSKYKIPWAVENMDNRKKECRNVNDLKKVFEQINAKMILDVNHCFSNDPSMELADNLINYFRDRIVGFHLSGFEEFHDPLYKTKQRDFFNFIFDKNLPVIIESVLDEVNDLEKEYNYVRSGLR